MPPNTSTFKEIIDEITATFKSENITGWFIAGGAAIYLKQLSEGNVPERLPSDIDIYFENINNFESATNVLDDLNIPSGVISDKVTSYDYFRTSVQLIAIYLDSPLATITKFDLNKSQIAYLPYEQTFIESSTFHLPLFAVSVNHHSIERLLKYVSVKKFIPSETAFYDVVTSIINGNYNMASSSYQIDTNNTAKTSLAILTYSIKIFSFYAIIDTNILDQIVDAISDSNLGYENRLNLFTELYHRLSEKNKKYFKEIKTYDPAFIDLRNYD